MNSMEIINSWKKKQFKPLYWLQGEEDYFIDEVMDYAEKHILNETEVSFNLTILYGKDAECTDVLNACKRYPVFAERQVVLIKEAQQMRDIDKLESYFEKPAGSTILVLGYKGKTLDGRTRFSKTVKENAEMLHAKKLYDNHLPGWTNGYVQSKGLSISPRALSLLVDHVGNDLSRITNEVNKLALNLENEKSINEDHIEKYIGISKDYNVFELNEAFSSRNLSKGLSIIQYFESNPKAGPVQLVLPTLYAFISRIMPLYQMADVSERQLRGLFYNNPSAIRQAQGTLKNYTLDELENAVLLLHHFNLKSLGIHSPNLSSGALLKELCFKIMAR